MNSGASNLHAGSHAALSALSRSKSQICAIAVMAKAPQAGRSKTRLVPPLTAPQAASLSAAFLRDITENIALAARQAPIHGCIAYAPAGLEHLFDGHLASGTGLVLADGTPPMPDNVHGFGRCLLHAIQSLLAEGYGAACVLNSDSPTLPTSVLVETANLLLAPGRRAVLGPAEDGGYYLLGLQTPEPNLFANIAWSTDTVTATTQERASEIGLHTAMLPSWYDVDDAVSLRRLTAELAAPAASGLAPYPAPASRACLAGFDLAQRFAGQIA